ncbi:MAG TPA: alpha/beta hydrolase [Spirochaetota bacterium]|nr:alpha/beta hydrolase [Spirochaetota bacterium]HOL58084.1 alpha/beta hydrolase [Spirochaetota bacterium]HPP05535.1 alpha/beta hydrolase [Spirochaetota bacterium]
MKAIVQGFGSKPFLFENFIKNFDDIYIIENNTNSYEEVERELLKLFNSKKIDIFGWSLGSLYAMMFTLNNPDKVRSLFLTGATARFTEKEGYNNGISQKIVEKMLVLIKRKKEVVMRDFYNNVFKFVLEKEKIIDRLMLDLPVENILENGLKALLEYDILDKLKNIKIPVLICNGIYDTITPKENAIAINRNILNSYLNLVEGGHCYFLENEEDCVRLWKNFLSQIT